MTDLIDPKLLFSPEIRAAFPPTARRMILKPIIDYINMLMNASDNQSSSDYLNDQRLNMKLLNLQDQITQANSRLSAIESVLNVPPLDPIADLPATSPVSISLANLANIGLLSNNENEDRKLLNIFLFIARSRGWIKK